MINAIVEGGEEMPVHVNSMSASCGPWTVQERGVTHSPLPCSPTARHWHGKLCLTKLPVTHFLSQPCTCTPLGDVMAGFPLGVALSTSGAMCVCTHVCLCVYIHQHAWLRHQSEDLWWMWPFIAFLMTSSMRQKLLEENGTSNRQGRKRTVGTWIQSQSWIIVIFFPFAFSRSLFFFLRYKYVIWLPPCILLVYSVQPSVNTYWARVVLFSSEEKQPLDVLNICRNNYSRLFYHRWPQWKW